MSNPLFDALFGQHMGKTTPFLHLADGSIVTHDEFLQTTRRYANVLNQLGLRPGDRVAVQIEKSPQALAIYAACVQAGMVFLPLNTAYTPPEISYFLENSAAKLFICQSSLKDILTGITNQTGTILQTLDANGMGTFAELAQSASIEFTTVERDGEDLAALLYTSGTTGRSKGAMLSQNNLISNAATLVDVWKFSAKDVLLHALPIFHTHGLFVATNVTLVAGGSMIFLNRFDLNTVIDSLPRASTMMGVPTFYTRLLSDPRFDANLSEHMRLFISGSAPLLAETHSAFQSRTGHTILERYGMTETNMNTSNPYEGERRAGTVGKPLPDIELRITDLETGDILPANEIGMIEVRGPNVFKGYWQMPKKTAEELRTDGFFISGDLGRIDMDGYVHIVGRTKDMIISGGYNIYPKEIELLLDGQQNVLESAVIGIPHPDFGETVVGILVAKDGAKLDLPAISEALSISLARFKHPKKLVIISELPRNAMGKVQKNLLRNRYEGEMSEDVKDRITK
ncbi:Long-chain-fatty-acid--CoA ligase [hydrothermal vent metagenome]|uniref:Long-chain-fatty-acid--CoA ligase n=1 Tax=hydrothermal vent metagenome TaxID=652676 RepID=A0A3B0UJH2_9ZZZZ